MHTYFGLIDGKYDTYKIAEKLERKLNLDTEIQEGLVNTKITAFDAPYGVTYYISVYEQDEDHNNQTYFIIPNIGEGEVLTKAILQIFGGEFKVNDGAWEKIDRTTKIAW